MAQKIKDVMTKDPECLSGDEPLRAAALIMRERDIGPVLVLDGDRLKGIVTDRDIVVRAVADGQDPSSTPIGTICSGEVTTLTPDDDVSEAIRIMRESAIRRIPVCEDGRPVGIVSIGDLAEERDRESALADISVAPANN